VADLKLPWPLTFEAAQREIMAHKRRMGFNTTDVEAEFGFIGEELAELHHAWRRNRAPRPRWLVRVLVRLGLHRRPPVLMFSMDVRDEIGDVLIFTMSLADILGINAGEAVAAKMRVNANRAYTTLPNGMHVKREP
jgi:NTP pyrophosphatase (non-canonical NTP hydrolase)